MQCDIQDHMFAWKIDLAKRELRKKLVKTTTQKIYVATAEYFIWVQFILVWFGLVLFRFSCFVNCVLFSDTTKKMLNTERSLDTYFLNKHIFDWFFNLDSILTRVHIKKHNKCLHCADVLSEMKKKMDAKSLSYGY